MENAVKKTGVLLISLPISKQTTLMHA